MGRCLPDCGFSRFLWVELSKVSSGSAWKPHRQLRMGLFSVQGSDEEAEGSKGKGSGKKRRKDRSKDRSKDRRKKRFGAG